MHLTFLTIHAVAAVLAAVAGVLALRRPRWAGSYVVLLAVSAAALAGVAATPTPGMLLIDLALLALFVVVLVRAEQARRVASAARAGSPRYVAGVGFGLISLAAGFLVVTVFDLGAPVWGIVATGVIVAVVGHLVLRRRLRALEGADGPTTRADASQDVIEGAETAVGGYSGRASP